ncbi:Heat shock protein 60 family chaperone GroEL / Thermosome subunit [Candidatus Methanomethylophilus alvi Mx1201]|uniref:Heat shock protein 60 family chaperone GroEL / Thermosome subunit n=2 Tax=Methanomethylophilus alvi TaxID=1291540 RepID=M9SDG3_METAX|nr:thermosome subunit beta [Methanomethylophilus alvi]AGI86321.1 Heat shock protein 60 family chaperone GroEL / Thermosome subunit [Candidatus Methanomethylophilus alvi Mx1201]AYQ55686.1 thermosome subunit [Methanomethylophilus alvi]MCI5973752.1 TCP-1/cpn60 chaperonin family protein [Methanomethylophilus alvi]MDD7479696.1 thermosome subunit beta [Methanomethylophilus alvi]MDY7060424.1 thermosome subunit beta [Methanomethylophilus alvi]
MGMGNAPVLILREGTKRDKGKDAQFNNITAARTIADAVRSSLGPRGMDKMLVDSIGDVVITNDGVTILKEMDVQHPAAKMLVEVAKTQDQEVGDGTTTSVIIAGELLKKSLDLIDSNVHPTIIAAGYRLANEKAQEILKGVAKKVSLQDEALLEQIAETSMISKQVNSSKKFFAKMVVDAVKTILDKDENGKYTADLKNIQTVKKAGANMEESELVKGLIIDKEPVSPTMPKLVKNAKIALIDAAFEVKKPEIDAKIQITDPEMLSKFIAEEEKTLKDMVDAVKKAGANVVFCQKGIDDLAQHFFAKEGIYACRRVKKSDMERLGKSTNASIVSKISELNADDLGTAETVELKFVGDEQMTFITGCKDPKTVSILVRGGTNHVADEVERSLVDAWSVVKVSIEDGMIVTGGGSTAMELAMGVRDYAASVGGREQIAIEAFASAMEIIPTTLAENAGLDPINMVIEMRKQHKAGKKYAGINPFTGKVEDMMDLNVIEPIRIGQQAISSATDAAVMILRIDDVIASKSAPAPAGGAPGMGGMDD